MLSGVWIQWTGVEYWTTGLLYWTGLLDWTTTGLDYWTDLDYIHTHLRTYTYIEHVAQSLRPWLVTWIGWTVAILSKLICKIFMSCARTLVAAGFLYAGTPMQQ